MRFIKYNEISWEATKTGLGFRIASVSLLELKESVSRPSRGERILMSPFGLGWNRTEIAIGIANKIFPNPQRI